MKRAHSGSVLRLRLAVPAIAAIAALAAAAARGAAQAAGPLEPRSATSQGTPVRLAAVPAPPMPGYTPAAASFDQFDTLVYTGSDTHAYVIIAEGPTAGDHGGRLIGGPGAESAQPIFGRGTDNALWQQVRADGPWTSLGGRLTSRPGVTKGGDVVVRGADGAVWLKTAADIFHGSGWRPLGGRVLAGSGPAVVSVDPSVVSADVTLYVLAVGTDRAVWMTHSSDSTHWTPWRSLGGRVSGDLAATSPGPGIGIVFARGTDNAAWYNQFAGTVAGVTPGWHSLGGRLTSGVGGLGLQGDFPENTEIVVMGTDNHIWKRLGTWPGLGPWTKVF